MNHSIRFLRHITDTQIIAGLKGKFHRDKNTPWSTFFSGTFYLLHHHTIPSLHCIVYKTGSPCCPFRRGGTMPFALKLIALSVFSHSSCSPRASTIGSPTPRMRVRLSRSPRCRCWWASTPVCCWRSEEGWPVLPLLTSGRTCTVAT